MLRSEIVWRILTLHCDEASRLTSESIDHELAGADALACRVHLLICGACRRHRREIVALRRMTRIAIESGSEPTAKLPDEARERIKRAIQGDRPTA
jgi:predicted anti-sigma-YlaC factor YlaD